MSQPCLPTSNPRRRKRDEPSSSSNEGNRGDDTNNKNGLVVTFDEIESMDASDYLARVIKQAKGMPDIFVADTKPKKTTGDESTTTPSQQKPQDNTHVPIDGSAASLSYLLSGRSSLTPPPSANHLPKAADPKTWIESVIANYERLRGYLERSKAEGFGGKETNRVPLPTMKDRPSWHVFCVGVDDASGNSGAYFANDYGEDDNREESKEQQGGNGDLPPWRKNLPMDGYVPTVPLLLQMDQVMIRRVLSHLCHYVHLGWSVVAGNGRRGEWIYALLSRLEKPVHRDDAAVLFGLLRDLTLARSKIDFSSNGEGDRKKVAKLNVLIVLIGVYFEQGGSSSKLLSCD